jgi:coenzyme F420-0:L-glutamate ligase / coenzyme F420-1:gamma-L-glutamate ligase
MPLTLTPLQNIPLIRRDDNLADIVVNVLHENKISLQDGDIFVFAQKIISKSEGRAVNLATITPSQRATELAKQTDKDARVVELILQESNEILRTRIGAIIVEHNLGFVCANAGIDHSNVAGAGDSVEEWVLLLPAEPDQSAEKMRAVIKPDLFGYKLQVTQVGAADELAAAASLMMGQAAEGTPVVHVRGFPYPLREGKLKELIRPKEQDLFR